MSEHEHEHHHDHSCCANLFGCGDEKGTGIIREDIKDAVYDKRASDRLLHMEAVDQEGFDGYLSAPGRWRRKFLQARGTLSRRPRRRSGWACSMPTCRRFSRSTPETSSAFPIHGRTSSTRCSPAYPSRSWWSCA